MKNILSKISGKSIMWFCIAACALPFVFIMIIGGQAGLSWLGLLACVGMHLVMMKMMPGHKSCHGEEASSNSRKPEEKLALPSKSSTEMEA
jgi:hypothetical protein